MGLFRVVDGHLEDPDELHYPFVRESWRDCQTMLATRSQRRRTLVLLREWSRERKDIIVVRRLYCRRRHCDAQRGYYSRSLAS